MATDLYQKSCSAIINFIDIDSQIEECIWCIIMLYTVNKDLLRMGITWEEAEVAAQNRSEWHWMRVESRSRSLD